MRAQCSKETPRNSAPLVYCKRSHRKSPDLRFSSSNMNSMQLSIIRHFLAPFVKTSKAEQCGVCSFIVRDANNQELAFVYCEDEPGRRSAASAPFFVVPLHANKV